MAKSPEQMAESMIRNMPENTGKSLEEWLTLAATLTFAKHGELVRQLKTDHGMTHGYANLVAHKMMNKPAGGDDLVAAQYSGKKAGLRPIYDALVKMVSGFGDDVEISPKKTCVSLRRNKQFALIQPSTATRVDLGINLKGEPEDGRLENSGSFNTMVSHRVRLKKAGQVDKAVEAWLKKAYSNA